MANILKSMKVTVGASPSSPTTYEVTVSGSKGTPVMKSLAAADLADGVTFSDTELEALVSEDAETLSISAVAVKGGVKSPAKTASLADETNPVESPASVAGAWVE